MQQQAIVHPSVVLGDVSTIHILIAWAALVCMLTASETRKLNIYFPAYSM